MVFKKGCISWNKGKKFSEEHKEMFRGGLETWKADRARIFNENGWKIIFFDETQVNENTVKSVLGN
jgi:hypothetical protein